MARTLRDQKLDTPSSRRGLKVRREPYWRSITEGMAVGYRPSKKKKKAGNWIAKHYTKGVGRRYKAIGPADDNDEANGTTILSFAQAQEQARAWFAELAEEIASAGKAATLTVKSACQKYIDFLNDERSKRTAKDTEQRLAKHVYPKLGEKAVSKITTDEIKDWRRGMVRRNPEDPEVERRSKDSANRVLTMLKAALNHAYDEGHVASRDAWGRRLAPFEKVEVARVRYLTVAEAERLINTCEPDFRALVRAGLETGCRYGELIRVEVCDFNPDAATLAIRQSKSGKPRHVVLTEEGAAFFRAQTAGRSGHELMFQHANGGGWGTSEQARPMAEACTNGKIKPAISFHILRHTWASLAVMNGTPLLVVAKNLGHADTRMVEKHYGLLAPSFIADAIRAGAPRYRVKDDTRVVPVR